MTNQFPPKRSISPVAMNILKKRYFMPDEKKWSDVVDRVIKNICDEMPEDEQYILRNMIGNRYFVPNSPTLVNAGKQGGGLCACYVVDFQDTIEEIYKTKFEFALIARKGGGCGTSLSKIRPEGNKVNGSAHGYAGGPIKFADTINWDMQALTQSGFRNMAIMFVQDIYHPDIIKFIVAKHEEGAIANANISVMVDDAFMEKVLAEDDYWTEFNGVKYNKHNAKEIFDMIVDGAWRNGEPGMLFKNRIDDSPYKYSNQQIFATNPCSEQPLPPNGVCNLGSLDISKFMSGDKFDFEKLRVATQLSVRFLDAVIDKTSYPTNDIQSWAMRNRPIGVGVMGLADYFLMKKMAYGSKESILELELILSAIEDYAESESIDLGKKFGIPKACKNLPVPRRNITFMTIAPTGTVSLIAGCSSGIEPIFSSITIRNDKTGTYKFENDLATQPYFRCAVSHNGEATEVTWQEHIDILAASQKYIDSGVSKTVNFPKGAHRDTVAKAFIMAWEKGCKGLAVYRNGSRKVEVLSTKGKDTP